MYNPRKKQRGKLHNLKIVHFTCNPKKQRVFLLLNTPLPSPPLPQSYNRLLLCTPTLTFFSTLGQGQREEEKKKEVKSSSLPYTFDNDCTLQLEQARRSICINILN